MPYHSRLAGHMADFFGRCKRVIPLLSHRVTRGHLLSILMSYSRRIHTLVRCLLSGAGEMTKDNIEIGIIGADRKFRVLTTAEVADYLAEAE